jgi:lipopolysaccharide/colanic/teichoic acid biosynthesis glycosyltransferase
MKRSLDIFLSIIALVALSPLLLLIGILVRIQLGGPVLFRQTRPGYHGKPFQLTKFRTMTDEKNSEGDLLPDRERLPRFGRFLRSTSLDELPELWNVLKGDMSLVGPRPLLLEYLDLYSPEQARRHDVRPGLSGWAQVNGRNALDWDEKLELDVWYVDNRSLWLDIKILSMTVAKVLKRDSVSHADHATMDKFRGSMK